MESLYTFLMLFVVVCKSNALIRPSNGLRECRMNSSLTALEVLPGGGWDNLRNLDVGRVMNLSYSQCQTTEDGIYLIPDEVFVIPRKTSGMETHSETIMSWLEQKSSTSKSINADVSFPSVLNGKFSEENTRMKTHQVRENSVTTRVQVRNHLYTVNAYPDFTLDSRFAQQIGEIADAVENNQTRLATYLSEKLILDYGTHVITSVDAGAILVQEDYIKSCRNGNPLASYQYRCPPQYSQHLAAISDGCQSNALIRPSNGLRECRMNSSLTALEVLPGGGWDNLRNIDVGRVMNLSYSQCQTTEDGIYLIPDEVFVIPRKTSGMETHSETIMSWLEQKSSTSGSINADISFPPVLNGKFSEENTRMKTHQVRTNSVTTRVQVRNHLYTVNAYPDFTLDSRFAQQIVEIADAVENNQTRQATYLSEKLILDYGTHVITSIDAGAILVQEDYIKSCQSGNPLARDQYRCPPQYSQHLAAISDGCQVLYCVQSGEFTGGQLKPIHLPPFTKPPLVNMMATNTVAVMTEGDRALDEGWRNEKMETSKAW
ncbi:hypothetical protein Q8A67_009855 [Cirrhinus molitorella]|uniref:Macrophage-expressed gene 1 protein n=1 Tax=Cirrhinus molitorella TaxID=172907 RepID=A0AA88Q099_9TELE|nr:hypothetical protein Q8A67_009855 [Cirrhinus molitorella]